MVKKSKLSQGQKRLISMGTLLPILPVTAAGSLPKHTELVELRYRVSKGVQNPLELERKEKLSTEVWVRQQEKMGLDVLVDGEMNRGDFIECFAKKINGFEVGGTVRCYGNRYYRKPVVRSRLEWKEPLVIDMWQYAQRMTHRPVKAVLTGPYTLMDWSFNEHYASRETLCRDLTAILRKEILALAELGAKIIQIDEPALASNPDEFSLVEDSIKELTRGVKSYFILRHCYGNLVPVWKKMQRLSVHNFHLEMANSRYSFLPHLKKSPTAKDVTIGIIDSHSRTIETPRQLLDIIRKLRLAVPANQLWLADDSGLKSRTIDEAIEKLQVLTEATTKQRAHIH